MFFTGYPRLAKGKQSNVQACLKATQRYLLARPGLSKICKIGLH